MEHEEYQVFQLENKDILIELEVDETLLDEVDLLLSCSGCSDEDGIG
ncbi:MAG: hypothetical protein IT314_17640 [Anaerolineales bacterium]|nr:hypothetical protein [Anaerolineales bacterium]